MNKSDFIVVSKDYPIEEDSKFHLKAYPYDSKQPEIGEIYEQIGRQVVDIIEFYDDYPRMIAKEILKDLANQYDWQYFKIVEDSYCFNNGLTLIGYVDKESCDGYESHGELGHECIDVDALKNNIIQFETGELYDLVPYFIEHKIGLRGKAGEGVYFFPFAGDQPLTSWMSRIN